MVIGLIVAIDALTKWLVRKKNLSFVENSGLPFGINTPGFFSLGVVVLGLILFLFLYQRHYGERKTFAWSLIVGGALANLLDRLSDGVATDFIGLGPGTLNLADVSIFLGIVLLFFQPNVEKGLLGGGSRPDGGTD